MTDDEYCTPIELDEKFKYHPVARGERNSTGRNCRSSRGYLRPCCYSMRLSISQCEIRQGQRHAPLARAFESSQRPSLCQAELALKLQDVDRGMSQQLFNTIAMRKHSGVGRRLSICGR